MRDDEEAAAEIASVLEQEGFEPELGPGEIRMRRCPFHDLAELGSDLELEGIDIFPEPDLCIARFVPG